MQIFAANSPSFTRIVDPADWSKHVFSWMWPQNPSQHSIRISITNQQELVCVTKPICHPWATDKVTWKLFEFIDFVKLNYF